MSEHGTSPRTGRHLTTFLLWGWAMLLVVLLSAAPTGAQPRTRLLGSAFDPATVSVVLSPKKPRLGSATPAPFRKRLPETGGRLLLVAGAVLSSAQEPLPRSQQPWLQRGAATEAQRPFARSYAPRAPPLA